YFAFFFFNDTATTEIYTLSLHDALPICRAFPSHAHIAGRRPRVCHRAPPRRSEEHTSELQSQFHLVCRLLLENKKRSGRAHREELLNVCSTQVRCVLLHV